MGEDLSIIRRGETTPQILSVNADLRVCDEVWVSYRQRGRTVVKKTSSELDIHETYISLQLEADETIKFAPGAYEAEIEFKLGNDYVGLSNIQEGGIDRTIIDKSMKGEII